MANNEVLCANMIRFYPVSTPHSSVIASTPKTIRATHGNCKHANEQGFCRQSWLKLKLAFVTDQQELSLCRCFVNPVNNTNIGGYHIPTTWCSYNGYHSLHGIHLR